LKKTKTQNGKTSLNYRSLSEQSFSDVFQKIFLLLPTDTFHQLPFVHSHRTQEVAHGPELLPPVFFTETVSSLNISIVHNFQETSELLTLMSGEIQRTVDMVLLNLS